VANPDKRLALYIKCKKWNTLPYPGGYMSQPADLIEAFDIIEHEFDKVEQENERARKRAK
jgi:hypothetical protein